MQFFLRITSTNMSESLQNMPMGAEPIMTDELSTNTIGAQWIYFSIGFWEKSYYSELTLANFSQIWPFGHWHHSDKKIQRCARICPSHRPLKPLVLSCPKNRLKHFNLWVTAFMSDQFKRFPNRHPFLSLDIAAHLSIALFL